MRWAQSHEGRALATPGSQGSCPTCGARVRAKCGEIISWHWAHLSRDCDKWSEPESDWHLGWKQRFPSDWQEVVIGSHRADVRTPFGILEFQKSSISLTEIKEREQFYGAMAWVIDAAEWWLMCQDSCEAMLPDGSARWLWPRKCWQLASAPIFLDRGDNIIWSINAIYQRDCHGKKETIVNYKEMTIRQFVERWTGFMSHQNILTASYHPIYGYLKNRPDLLPPWPAAGARQ